MAHSPSAQFVRDAHRIVRDLLPERPRRYWIDFLFTIAVAYVAFAVYLVAPSFSIAQAAALVVCGLAMYRAVVFTHEIAHRRPGTFVGFTLALEPARAAFRSSCRHFCTAITRATIRTRRTARGPIPSTSCAATVADADRRLPAVAARLSASRLCPVSRPHAPRAPVEAGATASSGRIASSLYVMNESYRRDYDARRAGDVALGAGARVLGVGVARVALLVRRSRLPLGVLGKIYLVTLLWIAINQVRTLAAHRYSERSRFAGELRRSAAGHQYVSHGGNGCRSSGRRSDCAITRSITCCRCCRITRCATRTAG